MPEFDIHLQCVACEGSGKIENLRHGVDAHGPWVDITDQECHECDEGFRYVGREHYDSVKDLKADYPESMVLRI